MSLEKYLQELAEGSTPLNYPGLLRLSGLAPDEVELFAREWESFDVEKRQGILGTLVETADDNVEVDFTPVFHHCLNDPDGIVREKAVLGLWESDDRTLIQPMVNLMEEDQMEQVRAAAARALGKFASLAEEGKLLTRDVERVREALLWVVQNGMETTEVRRRALEAVAPFNTPRVQGLVLWAYEHGDPGMCYSAVHAMGRNGDRRWLETILREAQSDDPSMRYEAAHACGDIGGEEVAPHLVPLVKDENHQVQLAAICALGMIGGQVARRVLSSCAASGDEVVQDAAQDALRNVEVGEDPLGVHF